MTWKTIIWNSFEHRALHEINYFIFFLYSYKFKYLKAKFFHLFIFFCSFLLFYLNFVDLLDFLLKLHGLWSCYNTYRKIEWKKRWFSVFMILFLKSNKINIDVPKSKFHSLVSWNVEHKIVCIQALNWKIRWISKAIGQSDLLV